MKKTYTIILFLLGLLALTTCHKDKEMEGKTPVVSNEEMTVADTQATISWKVDYVGSFHTGVDVSSHENMSEARRVEATNVGGKYMAVVDGLTVGTKYYYRIVVWNKYGSFEEETANFMTEEKTFYQVKATGSPADGGRVTGAGSYEENKYCLLNAIPNEGYSFVNWTENGNQVSANSGYTFKVTQDRTLVAHFALQKYTVSVSADPSGGGTVSGGGEYDSGQSCTVSATAASGYTFSKWTENGTQVSTNANYTFTVTGNRTLVAHFTELQGDEYNVNVSANPSEGGTVAGGGVFQSGASCTVTATANTGYTFANWTENGTIVSTDVNYTFTVNANRTLVANFTAQSYTISVSANPSAGGTVTGGGTYHYGDDCTVVAAANSGYTFTNWKENGSVVSSDASYSFTVTGNRTLEAVFTAQAPNEYTISVSANPTNGGTVSGGGTYQQGQSCTVTATANSGYTFTKWTENGTQVSTDADYTFTVTGNRNLVAHFTVCYTINVTANPSSGGTVSGGGTYSNGQGCVVRAVANSGYSFTNWTENGNVVSTDADYGFVVTRDRTLVANFANNTGGHAYVDLGLPSGLLWATCNIGADLPEDYGDYFAWAETQSKNNYDWSNYQYCMGTGNTLTKYCNDAFYGYNGYTDNLTILEPSDDAATANWGIDWRMPTKEEWQELLSNTTNTWTTQNGVYGELFTATNGNSLFLPAAGYIYNEVGSAGYYWSRSLYLDCPYWARCLHFNSGECAVFYHRRYNGFPVRPVREN